MKKRRKKVLACAIIVAAVVLGAAGCQIHKKKYALIPDHTSADDTGMREKSELIGRAADEEEARGTAKLYGITFLDFRDGMALFETDEDPLAVIERGEREGYPQLWQNHIRTADEEIEAE